MKIQLHFYTLEYINSKTYAYNKQYIFLGYTCLKKKNKKREKWESGSQVSTIWVESMFEKANLICRTGILSGGFKVK